MAPEQRTTASADARSDQYALMVSLYEALEQQRPAGPLVFRRRVPAWLRELIARGLSVPPGEQFRDLVEVARVIERGLGARRRRAVAAVALVLAGALIVTWQLTRRAPAGEVCTGASDHLRGVWDAAATRGDRAQLSRHPPAVCRSGHRGCRARARQLHHRVGRDADRRLPGHPRARRAVGAAARICGWPASIAVWSSSPRSPNLFRASDPQVVDKAVGAASSLTELKAVCGSRRARCGDPDSRRPSGTRGGRQGARDARSREGARCECALRAGRRTDHRDLLHRRTAALRATDRRDDVAASLARGAHRERGSGRRELPAGGHRGRSRARRRDQGGSLDRRRSPDGDDGFGLCRGRSAARPGARDAGADRWQRRRRAPHRECRRLDPVHPGQVRRLARARPRGGGGRGEGVRAR